MDGLGVSGVVRWCVSEEGRLSARMRGWKWRAMDSPFWSKPKRMPPMAPTRADMTRYDVSVWRPLLRSSTDASEPRERMLAPPWCEPPTLAVVSSIAIVVVLPRRDEGSAGGNGCAAAAVGGGVSIARSASSTLVGQVNGCRPLRSCACLVLVCAIVRPSSSTLCVVECGCAPASCSRESSEQPTRLGVCY